MVESRILGAGMILLFPLRILINKASEIKAACHFNKYLIVNCSYLAFHRGIIYTLSVIRVCDYLLLNNLRPRFIIVKSRSIQLIRYGRRK